MTGRRGNRRGGREGQRGGGQQRSDRDGDVAMDTTITQGRRRNNNTPNANRAFQPRRDPSTRVGRPAPPESSRRLEDLTRNIQKHGVPNLDDFMNDAPPGTQAAAASSVPNAPAGIIGTVNIRQGATTELKVTNWVKNTAASNTADGGVQSLKQWLETKARGKLKNKKKDRKIEIHQHRVEDNTLFIDVLVQDATLFLGLNNYRWAGTNINVERTQQITNSRDDGKNNHQSNKPGQSTEGTKRLILEMLQRRYDEPSKYLDLGHLGEEEDLQKRSWNKIDATRMFEAIMLVIDKQSPNVAERDSQITSVSLANNNLEDLTVVTSLSQTLPNLLNLDLANNKFAKLSALDGWRTRFPRLQHLILSGNPLTKDDPDYAQRVLTWYPNLRMLDGIQVRTEEDVAKKITPIDMPFPIRAARFHDEMGIVQNFILTFFAGFDTNRAELARMYYDAQSDFSFSINTRAPRDPTGTQQTEKQEWEHYIKNSRNMKKITQLQARQNRIFRGTEAVIRAFEAFPRTRHADLGIDAGKYLYECYIQPGLPDPTKPPGQGTVNGFLVSMHGEFEEVDEIGQVQKKRSFDRTFILGPTASGAIRVVNDLLLVRAYGGTQAFTPDPEARKTAGIIPPEGNLKELSPQLMKVMVVELQSHTGLKYEYAEKALAAKNWVFADALAVFREAYANKQIPNEAWADFRAA